MRVVKIKLLKVPTENSNEEQINKILWSLQDEVRSIANRAVQLCYKNMTYEQDYYKQNGEYPTKEQSKAYNDGRTMGSYIYNSVVSEFYKLNTVCVSSLLQNVINKFGREKKEYLKGTRSIPYYKRNMPIDVPKRNISLIYEQKGTAHKWSVKLSLLSNKYKKELHEPKGQLLFGCIVRDKSTSTILERCYDDIYNITASKLSYENGWWYLHLGYNEQKCTNESVEKFEDTNVCSCVIGEWNAIYATNNTNGRVLQLDGGEVENYRTVIEAKRRALLKSRVACGEGSIGRGYRHRVSPAKKYGDKISNFRDTTNHRYSRAIVDYAVENKCGTLILEKLEGITEKNKRLRNWSYYDLQNKIQYKAQSKNIKVIFVDGTSLRNICNNCGAVLEISAFSCGTVICKECGKHINFDKNMSANMIVHYESSQETKKSK